MATFRPFAPSSPWAPYVILSTTIIFLFLMYSYHETDSSSSCALSKCSNCALSYRTATETETGSGSGSVTGTATGTSSGRGTGCSSCHQTQTQIHTQTQPVTPEHESPLARGSPMSSQNIELYRSTIHQRADELKFVLLEKEGCSPFIVFNIDNSVPENDGDIAQRHIVQGLGLHEQCAQDPNIRVVDVGGLLGDFGFMAASCGCRVDIFEPQLLYFSLISAGIQINAFGSLASVHNRAVASKPIPVRLQNAQSHDGSAKMMSVNVSDADADANADAQHFIVNTNTIDNIFHLTKDRIYLLKIDVEGFDPDVLLLATEKLLSERRVTYVIMEYTTHFSSAGMGPWDNLLLRIHSLGHVQIFCLHRNFPEYFGPIQVDQFDSFYESHLRRHLQTDLFLVFNNASLPHGGPSGMWSEAVFA